MSTLKLFKPLYRIYLTDMVGMLAQVNCKVFLECPRTTLLSLLPQFQSIVQGLSSELLTRDVLKKVNRVETPKPTDHPWRGEHRKTKRVLLQPQRNKAKADCESLLLPFRTVIGGPQPGVWLLELSQYLARATFEARQFSSILSIST